MILLPSEEVLVADSNPDVFYNAYGNVSINAAYPEFQNNGHTSYLHQQQSPDVNHPTEYRVEIFAPTYMDSAARPVTDTAPETIKYGQQTTVSASGLEDKLVKVQLSYSGFHTHAVDMGQRMVELELEVEGENVTITGPANASVMPPGVYLLWVVADGVPSEARWVSLQQ